jgi:hypothetical protein
MRNISEKFCRENQNTLFICSNFLFENRAVKEIMWKKLYCRAGRRRKYGACAFHARYLKIQTVFVASNI